MINLPLRSRRSRSSFSAQCRHPPKAIEGPGSIRDEATGPAWHSFLICQWNVQLDKAVVVVIPMPR
ncbi:hypothetical protein K443DRAFT_672948 [Laccaria amethystina LaAM-08-1]|uniref:Uncharacterized protein n=1 Tax=Laccaria amethystina LaAM-08-1 TaxID=1095629 RepID=A0A0C9XSZ7_9AGAR|nr:hypothetical protein K443DRAFT_672948 [Laccaria amethystina LaAM-08-1]